MSKHLFTVILLLFGRTAAYPCDACEKQQPEFTRGITHGAGPGSDLDWVIVTAMIVISLIVTFFSLKYLIQPGEKKESHIKHSILN